MQLFRDTDACRCYSVGRKGFTMLILGFVYSVGAVLVYLKLERT